MLTGASQVATGVVAGLIIGIVAALAPKVTAAAIPRASPIRRSR
jgi:hypothetical protein